MKAVILAGGFGTRISEESQTKPKPMIEIGGKPILWHIMKTYAHYGINDFLICLGYKGYVIKEYFANYALHNSDVTFNLEENKLEIHKNRTEPWKITLIDTGENTMTGGRLLRIKKYLLNENIFCMTYGDGVSDVNITNLIKFHKAQGKLATLTAVFPPARFGALEIENNQIISFKEKPRGDDSLINGGYFVLSSKIFNYIENDDTIWEREPLQNLAKDNELMAYKHEGFWQPMDTLRDKILLEKLINNKTAEWIKW